MRSRLATHVTRTPHACACAVVHGGDRTKLGLPPAAFRVSFTPVLSPLGLVQHRGSAASPSSFLHPWRRGWVIAVSVSVDLRRRALDCVMAHGVRRRAQRHRGTCRAITYVLLSDVCTCI